jgi:uncharacterized protein (TIGR03067 family)
MVALVVLSAALTPGTSPGQSIIPGIDGDWKIVTARFAGHDDLSAIGNVHTINNGKMQRPNRRTREYRLTFEPTTESIGKVDLTADRLDGEILKGIYSLNENGFTICYAYEPSMPRPSEFKSPDGQRVYLYAFERVAEPKSPNASAQRSSLSDIDGKWRVIGVRFAGEEDRSVIGDIHTFADGKLVRPNRRTREYSFTLDPTTITVGKIDLTADRLDGKTLKGIYTLDDNKMTICYAYEPSMPRPREFATPDGQRIYLYEYGRAGLGN